MKQGQWPYFVGGVVAGALVIAAVDRKDVIFNQIRNTWRGMYVRADIPADANEHCPGVGSQDAGKVDACAGCPNRTVCSTGGDAKQEADPALMMVKKNLEKVKHKLLVLSGKGGVGKSTVSSLLAVSLAKKGYKVGLLDIDICGPSVPTMFGLVNGEIHPSAEGWSPIYVMDNLALMSVGFLLSDPNDAVIWRGPKKNGLIRQFLSDVIWDELDILLIDTPPGTSDEHLSIVTYMKEAGVDGAILVTTPQEVALADVRKEATFCEKTGLKVVGIVENMCQSIFDNNSTFSSAAIEDLAVRCGCSVLQRIPLESTIMATCDYGVQEEDVPIHFDDLGDRIMGLMNNEMQQP